MNGWYEVLLISIIVPIYNVSSYLQECLESILSQDYPFLEIILVDDGSTDDSGKICDEYAKRDSRIRVIHQPNGGAAAAKNAGLRAASGEYLSFVDSDDFLEPGAYAHMVQLMEVHEADIVQCDFRDVFRDHTCDRHLLLPGMQWNTPDYLARFTKDWTCGLIWNKLYKRSLFDGIFFETGHKIDDEYFTYRGVMNAGKIVCDDRIVYNYRRRVSSVMLSSDSGQQIVSDRIDYLSKRRRNVIERFPQLRAAYDSHFLDMMIILSRDAYATKESIEEIRRQLKSYFREKGHSRPDYRLLPALANLMLGSVDSVLNGRKQVQSAQDTEVLFE